MKRRIVVDNSHIRRGNCGNAESCPIALAMKDVLPEDYYVSVDRYSMSIIQLIEGKPGGFRVYTLPKAAQNFVKDFDRASNTAKKDDLPAAFAFTLDITLPTSTDTGDSFCTEVAHPFDLDSTVEPSLEEMEKIKHHLFG
jgi:hypothetical protein